MRNSQFDRCLQSWSQVMSFDCFLGLGAGAKHNQFEFAAGSRSQRLRLHDKFGFWRQEGHDLAAFDLRDLFTKEAPGSRIGVENHFLGVREQYAHIQMIENEIVTKVTHRRRPSYGVRVLLSILPASLGGRSASRERPLYAAYL